MKISRRVSEILSGHHFHIKIFKKDIILYKNVGGLWFSFSAHRVTMLYICIKSFMKIAQRVPELLSRHDFQYQNFQWGTML